MGPGDYACAWCAGTFLTVTERNVHEETCLSKGIPKVSPILSDPLTMGSMYDEWEWPSFTAPPSPPTADELMHMKVDRVVDHLLDCIKLTTDPEAINIYVIAIEKVAQSKDLFPLQEEA